ncbi:hypothetical protein COM55_07640 [Bacillus pseudomycoides]|uniref:hypothetical protein n=1 Tax=Bacillus pseudomycoides TaxID=64104 RepID=UPI000BF55B29|nr:hypothetical protein [Bacillus pseudomycoides]PGE86623.1 hypothetical protein COM55_07640 [Bacillus pseudomycoides]
MPKRQTNKLRWLGDLLKLGESIDPDTDRVIMGYPFERKIRYNNIGVTVTDKHFSRQDGNEIMKKIEVRLDRAIEENQKDYRIKIKDTIYNIDRVYVREDERIMELNLSYAN